MRKPIKIVFDASPLLVNKTGVAYYVERLITQLAKKYPDDIELVGYYFNFLGKRSSSHFPTAPNLRFHGIYFLPSKVLYQLRRWNINVPVEFLSHTKADFILFPNFLGWPSLFRTPSAPVIHDLTYLDLPQYVSAKNQRDLERFVPKQIDRSDFVITVSEFSKREIAQNYQVAIDDILVTPIPPEPPVTYTKEVRNDILAKLGITQPFIVTVGTIEPRKNIIKLLSAYTQLPQSVQDKFTLVVAGRVGWNCEAGIAELAKVAKKGFNIVHVGYFDDQAREVLYQSASLFVSASHYEGFGMPVLEAMRYGTPVAISDIPVFHEVAGNAADYFDQEKPSVIAGHLEGLLTNEALLQKLGQEAKSQAASFSWDAVAESLYSYIERTVRNTRT